MKTSTLKARFARYFDAFAKARLNSALLQMGRGQAESLGYSYDALKQGVSAWPWRTSPHNCAPPTSVELKTSSTGAECSDAVLSMPANGETNAVPSTLPTDERDAA